MHISAYLLMKHPIRQRTTADHTRMGTFNTMEPAALIFRTTLLGVVQFRRDALRTGHNPLYGLPKMTSKEAKVLTFQIQPYQTYCKQGFGLP